MYSSKEIGKNHKWTKEREYGDDGRQLGEAAEEHHQRNLREGERLGGEHDKIPNYIRDICPQGEEYGLNSAKAELVDNIDAWAMWISPPLFVVWNFVYWLGYQL